MIFKHLTNWCQILRKKHDFLLYLNLDSPVLVLYPVTLDNFAMFISSYIISYLDYNY